MPAQSSGPTFETETACRARNLWPVCGVDEAGRGPLAGPVVAAAVILDPDRIPAGLRDSKKLSEAAREALFDAIMERAIVSVAQASVEEIDTLNIRAASLLAMARAVAGLGQKPAHALVDGNALPDALPCSAEALVKGDDRSVSIAAASIIAKVTRDRLMVEMARAHPQFGFERHKGYPTADHRAALMTLGPCPHHRRSFAPVRAALAAIEGRAIVT